MKIFFEKMDILLWAILAACIIVILIPAFLWESAGPLCLWVLSLLVPFGILGLFVGIKRSKVKKLESLREQWGKVQERKRDFKIIDRVFKHKKKGMMEEFYIDDLTWDDLNMEQIYGLLDRTLTTPGEQFLYHMLRTPVFEEECLKKRGEIIRLFEKDPSIREKVQLKLLTLGRQREGNTETLLWEDLPGKSRFLPLFHLTALSALISLVLIPILGIGVEILLPFLIFGINFFINYRVKKKILLELSSVRYLAGLISISGRIGDMDSPELKEYTGKLNKYACECSLILRKIGKLVPFQTNDMVSAVYEYANILFLIEVRSFYTAVNEIGKRVDALKGMYFLVGELDALISAASYRTGIERYTEPAFMDSMAEIKVLDGRHPLLKAPVPNTITIRNKGIVITGCNMSGKSTFLRTIGVNALFAQTIYTCLASHYEGSFLRVMTSISRGDNLVGGKSYYLAEAEALLRIIDTTNNRFPCLCILDEMFRGTNSLERINASAEILKYLMEHNSLVIIATHDYELVDMVGNLYRCYYFSENIEKEGISFDYKIKEGASKVRNAVKLMKYLGYPEEIVNNINSKIKSFQ